MQRFSIRYVSVFAVLLAVLSIPALAQRLPTNHTEDLWSTGSQPLTVTLEVPTRGWLAVEVTSPGGATQAALHPWLEFSSPVRTVHRQHDRHLFEVPAAGTYQFHIGSIQGGGLFRWSSVLLPTGHLHKEGGDGDGTEEPDNQVLPLMTRWSDLCRIGAERESPVPEKDGGEGDGTEEPDNQVLPVTVGLPDLCRIDWSVRSAKSSAPEKDGGEGDGTEEPDNQVLPLLYGGVDCAAGAEPANNLSLCARSLTLGAAVSASLAEGFGVDQDYFVFDLRRATRVEVATTGTADTFGTLFDAFGHALLADDDSGEDSNFALAATLGPGRYFVRVEGLSTAAGDYDLQVRGVNP